MALLGLSTVDILLAVISILYAIYLYGTWTFSKFKNTIIPFNKPVPLLGNMARSMLRRENMFITFHRVYTSFPDKRFAGFFQTRIPTIMIRDPDLIRQIGVKDFDHFVDHRNFLDDKLDPLFGNNLFAMKGQKWRDMRATLSPAFTGSKMRNMYVFVSDCAKQMAEHLLKKSKDVPVQETEMKKLFTVYTNDVIATAAFGIKVDTLENPDNEFYAMGKQVSNFGGIKASLKFFGFFVMPSVMRLFKIKFFSDNLSNFFRELVHGTMKAREEQGIIRHDMIHLLMQARKGALGHENLANSNNNKDDAGFATVEESDIGKTKVQKRVWTDDDLTAQALIFFLAGFDTAATLLSFAAHELAVNPDCQKELQQEIDDVREELGEGNAPDYERINRMKYLDMVVAESLRMWPPAGFVDRVCVKPYMLEDYDGNKYKVEVGDSIIFPAYSLQRDEKYYENPEKFDPERFSEERKKDINPFTYLPFGVGPRNCIGSRFALMEVKAILFHILSHFDFVPCAKTSNPVELTTNFQLMPKNGFWLNIIPRKTE